MSDRAEDMKPIDALAEVMGLGSDQRSIDMKWAKDRALAYVERGELLNALASFNSDLNKTGLATRASDMLLSMLGAKAVQENNVAELRRLIEGFRE